MTFHTNSNRVPDGFNLGNYEKHDDCMLCDHNIWYETDEHGKKWHKSYAPCPWTAEDARKAKARLEVERNKWRRISGSKEA